MAKTTAPLLSLDASGQIAKTLVASKWKGRQYMRRYVIPANPQTTAQTAQRGRMTAAAARWHDIAADDRTAYDLSATLTKQPLTGANIRTRQSIREQKDQTTAYLVHSLTVTAGSEALTVSCQAMDESDGSDYTSATDLYVVVGTSATNLGSPEQLTYSDDHYEATVSGLTAGDAYYVRVYRGTASTVVSGTYSGTPTA